MVPPKVGTQISSCDASDQMDTDLMKLNVATETSSGRMDSIKLNAGTEKSKSKFMGLRNMVPQKLLANHDVSQGGWRAIPFIYVSSSLESFAFFGVVINLVTYLVEEMHFGVPTAANTVTTWAGTTCLTPLLGGFIADTYFGRYLTLLLLGFVELLGFILLTISAAAPSLRPPPLDAATVHPASSKAPRILQVGFLLTALYVIALGKAGYGACVLSLGADQFDEKDQEERRKLSSYFNWFFLVNCIGIFFSIGGLVFVEDKVSWVWGYGVAAGAMALGNIALFSGYSFYRHHAPLGSPFTHIARVFVAAIGKRKLPNPPTSDPFRFHDFQDDGAHQGRRARLQQTNQFRFLDKAAIPLSKTISSTVACDAKEGPWGLCHMTEVEEVKTILRILPLWFSTIFVFTMNSQATTFLVRQASAMDRHITPHFEYPSASLGLFAIGALYIFVPIYEKLLVPVMRRITGIEQGITTLQRVGVGALLGVLAMVVSALVESKRLLVVRANAMTLIFMPSKPLPMSVFWLCPQIIFVGLSECFTLIGLNEFYYCETPQGMRTMGAAFNMSAQGLGSYGSSLLVLLVVKATTRGLSPGWLTDDLDESRLDYFYWLLAVLGTLNFAIFIVCSRWYRYKLLHEQVEELPEIGVKSSRSPCS